MTFTLGKFATFYRDPAISAISTLALVASAGGRDDAVRLHDLTLDGTRLREAALSAEDGQSDIALLERLTGNFTLAGEVRMRWDDAIDARNPGRMMFQLAGYGTPPGAAPLPDAGLGAGLGAAIPEPASALLLLTGALGLIGQRRWRGVLSPRAATREISAGW